MRLVWIDEMGNEYPVCTPDDIVKWVSENKHTWSRELSFHTIRMMGEARLESIHDARNDPALH